MGYISLSRCRVFSWVAGLNALLLGIAPASTVAQQTHADLSISAVLSPPYFVPGGRNTVELTVHNAGPDAIDNPPDFSISVFGESYIVTTQPPPYEVLVDAAKGCWAERFVTEPLPDGNIALGFDYYFAPIAAGASRTCTYEIEFYPSTLPPLTFRWRVSAWYALDNIDPNPSNDTFIYTLNAAPSVPPTPVPAGSPMLWIFLGVGLASLTFNRRRSTNT